MPQQFIQRYIIPSSITDSSDSCKLNLSHHSNASQLKIAVIGGGPCGLCAAKHALDYKYSVTLYEQTRQIGGTWVYTDRTGTDENGLPIHTSMYKGLSTNVPIETMGFPEYPFPKRGKSFVTHDEVLAFFESYARKFKVKKVIKFSHQVIRVRPVGEARWEVLVKNVQENSYSMDVFDAIFVCSGHYNVPFYPKIEGMNLFKGRSMHSRDYRRPELFKDENILVIGAGPSGKDIVYEIARTANRVIFSHHRDLSRNNFGTNVTQKGDIQKFTENGVVFVDGSTDTFTSVLFCTGYQFSLPFLSLDSGLHMEDGCHIQPLYKHLININHPTMAIIGLQTCTYTYMYDMQVRLCLKYWSGEKQTPSKAAMLEDTKREMEKQIAKGHTRRQLHLLGADQTDYFDQLADAGDLENMPEVLLKIFNDCTELRIAHGDDYRKFDYTIIDDKTFTRSKIDDDLKI